MGAQLAFLVVVLMLFGNSGGFSSLAIVLGRRGNISADLTSNKFGPSCTNISCNIPAVEDKRGVPTGANPLHNR